MKVLATEPYKDWQVYMSDQLFDEDYQRSYSDNKTLQDYCEELMSQGRLCTDEERNKLHLTEGQRSIRNRKVSDFVNTLLSCKVGEATDLYNKIYPTYKIYLTRNIQTAKEQLKKMKSYGEYPEIARMGMLMSSEAARMRPLGYEIKKVSQFLDKTPNWFLDPSEYVCSSDYLEVALNEFFVQGLEIDYTTVMWDADFRYNPNKNEWDYFCFDGSQTDKTRSSEFYDDTYEYLKSIGIEEI